MTNNYYSFICALLFFPLFASGDDCSDTAPATTKYSKTLQCPAVSILTQGEKYPEDNWECYDLVPIKTEKLFYSSAKNKGPLPTLNSLLPPGEKDFKNRTWVASDMRCNGKDKVTIRYWGGGNCKGCEHKVDYQFSNEGKLEDVKLQ